MVFENLITVLKNRFFLGALEKKLQRTLLKKDRGYEVNI